MPMELLTTARHLNFKLGKKIYLEEILAVPEKVLHDNFNTHITEDNYPAFQLTSLSDGKVKQLNYRYPVHMHDNFISKTHRSKSLILIPLNIWRGIA